jgi:hypothetical protein
VTGCGVVGSAGRVTVDAPAAGAITAPVAHATITP